MKTHAATTREQIACLLVAERFSVNELAEALEMTRGSALATIRRIDRDRLRRRLSMASVASTWTAPGLPTLRPTIGSGG